MEFDFCIRKPNQTQTLMGLDTIFRLWGDESYQTPRKEITPGKTYFALTTEGCGLIDIDGQTLALQREEYVFLHPRKRFSYRCKDRLWEFWWFEFTQLDEVFPVNSIEHVQFHRTHATLLEQGLRYAKEGAWDVTEGLYYSLCHMLLHEHYRRQLTGDSALFNQITLYIREHSAELTVKSLCEFYQMSDRTLRNLFARNGDSSPVQVIQTCRMEKARQLLLNTSLTIGQIADALGYGNQFYFSRCFREKYGLSPAHYRSLDG